MRLISCTIENFGKLNNVTYDSLVNVILYVRIMAGAKVHWLHLSG